MADIINPNNILEVKRDISDIGKAVNESTVVTPRSGLPFDSLPLAIQKVLETGGFEPFQTESALKASTPTLTKKAAYALDTHKIWLWQNNVWIDTGSSVLDKSQDFTLSQKQMTYDFNSKSINGGTFEYAATSDFKALGYINASGVFVSSTAGYKTTDFIPIDASTNISAKSNASSAVAQIAFYDASKIFISAVVGNGSELERTFTVPVNAKYIRSSFIGATASIYKNFVGVLNNPSLLKTSSLDLVKSANLADLSLTVSGSYVNSSGGITTLAGWKYIKIPVESGKTYTFGRFSIDQGGYYVFQTSANGQISGSNGNYTNSSLPVTLTAPMNAEYLLIDIARPTNTEADYAQLTVNEGSLLIDYVEPSTLISGINGIGLIGQNGGSPEPVGDFVEQNGNATLADLVADSVTTGALIANLPTSNVGLEVGQAYIDTATATIKVVM